MSRVTFWRARKHADFDGSPVPGELYRVAEGPRPARALSWARIGAVISLVVILPAALTGCSASHGHKHSASSTPVASNTPTVLPTRTTEVPAPSSGTITHVIPATTPATAAPVALDSTAQLSGGVKIALVSIKSIKVAAQGPGEIAGAALAVTVKVTNDTSKPLNLVSAYLTLLDAKGQVGTPTPTSPAAPLQGTIGTGRSATGVYVFNIAATRRNPINVYVAYSAGGEIAHFTGNAN